MVGRLGPYALHRPPWKSASPGLLGPPGSGAWGGQRCHPRAQALQPRPAPGRDRSLPLRPHYRGELPGLAEEPDGCGGGGEASLAPNPGLNIYYVLFGLWGKGGEDCRIDPELPAKPGQAQGLGRCPRRVPPEPPRQDGTQHPGRGLRAAGPLGRADRSGLPRGAPGSRCCPGNDSPSPAPRSL